MDNTTLQELENDYWESPSHFPTEMIRSIYELRKKSLSEFETNDIRLMISQNIGLKYLVPRSLEILENNIFEEGLYYPGDLLLTVLDIKPQYWKENLLQKEVLAALLKKSRNAILESKGDRNIRTEILDRANKFIANS